MLLIHLVIWLMCSSNQWDAEGCALMALLFLPPQAKMPFDANKLYCSEVLAILLQNNDGEPCLPYLCQSGQNQASLRSQQPFSASSSPLLASLSPVCSLSSTLSFSAAFVLCQAVLILFADVSVLDGCKIWQLASFFSLFFPLPPTSV